MFVRKSWSHEVATKHFDSYFAKLLKSSRHQTGLQVWIESHGFTYRYAAGRISASNGAAIRPNQPFHTASIGKVFTAVLLMKLAESGKLSLDSPVETLLPPSELENLFVYRDVDYAHQVTIKQLLGHTSGLADYFEDPVIHKPMFIQRILANPQGWWTPETLIAFTRENQGSFGTPASRFHYSDTGYILLGRIIERVTGKSFSDNLHDEIFSPLRMNDSYLMFYSQPKHTPAEPIQDIWLNKVEISRMPCLSCDWAGGGIVTTPQDLLLFQKALWNGTGLEASSLQAMTTFTHQFRNGIHYGLGMMELQFEGFFFLLRGLPRLQGHSGILGTHMFSHPETETHIVMNFGSSTAIVRSYKALIEVVMTLKRMQVWG
ncbi:serine hydrolase domain-containing protein [Paenibacillus qinlingensis]|uniref:serine hydrolase domain-containing protein n=1 Tax=Paenibacillus qinlingensis TaxID=1837343 RepID=UPI001564BBC5|nr:serine hydrolase domain-containing protein [Paenibacillus qinlingensis]NQX62142.1 beta-lactamase family protein [Paenibacillus qinlingensis]